MQSSCRRFLFVVSFFLAFISFCVLFFSLPILVGFHFFRQAVPDFVRLATEWIIYTSVVGLDVDILGLDNFNAPLPPPHYTHA